MWRRGFVEKVCLGYQQHLPDAFGQGLETWIIQDRRVHELFRVQCYVHIHHPLRAYAINVPISKKAFPPAKALFPRLQHG
jgi:hypothetical protein